MLIPQMNCEEGVTESLTDLTLDSSYPFTFADQFSALYLNRLQKTFYKQAQVTPLPKVSHPKLYKDLCLESLLFHIGELCEQVIVNKLKSRVQTAISSSQFAYRPKLGTTEAFSSLLTIAQLTLTIQIINISKWPAQIFPKLLISYNQIMYQIK